MIRTYSHFDKSKLPSPKVFYERELGHLSKPSNGHVRTACPFHKGKNKTAFSIDLSTGGFFCFNCNVSGSDIIEFVRLKYGLTFKEACKYFGIWNDEPPSPEIRRQVKAEAEELARQAEAEEDREAAQLRERMRLRGEIHLAVQLHRDAAARLNALHYGASPIAPSEEDALWGVMALALDDRRLTETAYMKLSGLEHTDEI
jgi:hypothetical protein